MTAAQNARIFLLPSLFVTRQEHGAHGKEGKKGLEKGGGIKRECVSLGVG